MKNVERGEVNPADILKKVDLDNKSKRLLQKYLEGLPKPERIEILKQRFPQLFGNSQLVQEPMPSASD